MRTVTVSALAYLSMVLSVCAADSEHELVLPGHEASRVIRYVVVNGRAILDGDVDLGPVEELGTRRVGEVVSSKDEKSVPGIGVTSQPLVVQPGGRWIPGPGGGRIYLDYLWPGGVVPYVIDRSVSENSALRQHVMTAIQDWRRTNVTFVARNGERDYVRFVVDNSIPGGGQSRVGRQGYRQDIKLRASAESGVIIHEMGHAVGVWHEHSRMDRDEFVRVLWENVRDDAKSNFQSTTTA
jgi:Astacin (Peptidase family M12A)